MGEDSNDTNGIAVYLVPTGRVEDVWKHAEFLFDRAADTSHGMYSGLGLFKGALDGYRQVWLAADGVKLLGLMLTSIQAGDEGKCLSVDFLVGENRKAWADKFEDVIRWAKDQGATKITAIGREGLAKAFPKFRKTGIMLEMKLRE